MTTQQFCRLCSALIAGALLVPTLPAFADPLPIVSYAMQNGQAGSQTYFDDTYGGPGSSGNPNASGSPLSGGLGQLTDGIFADYTDIFDDDWVGWNNIQPSITIDLGSVRSVDFASVHASNWSPPFQDVGAPGSVNLSISLDNVSYTNLGPYVMLPEDRTGDESRWINFPLGGFDARYVRVQLFDGTKIGGTDPGGPKPWIFLDEVRVDGTIPEPTSAILTTSALVALAFGRRQRGSPGP